MAAGAYCWDWNFEVPTTPSLPWMLPNEPICICFGSVFTLLFSFSLFSDSWPPCCPPGLDRIGWYICLVGARLPVACFWNTCYWLFWLWAWELSLFARFFFRGKKVISTFLWTNSCSIRSFIWKSSALLRYSPRHILFFFYSALVVLAKGSRIWFPINPITLDSYMCYGISISCLSISSLTIWSFKNPRPQGTGSMGGGPCGFLLYSMLNLRTLLTTW